MASDEPGPTLRLRKQDILMEQARPLVRADVTV